MEKYANITNTSELIEAINNKNIDFQKEWNEIGNQRSGSVQKTLRYSILKKYWDNPEGEYKDVFQALLDNDFEIRRVNYKIYNAFIGEQKEDKDSNYTDEITFIMDENKFFDYYYLHNPQYFHKHNPDIEVASIAIKKAVEIYCNNPKVLGPDIEGYLLSATYYLELKDEFKNIIDKTDSIPYSSHRVSEFMQSILNENDIAFFEDILNHKPEYFKNLNKTIGIDNIIKYPTDSNSGLGTVNNLLNLAYQKSSLHEDEADNMFQFFMRNLDRVPLNISGEIVTAKEDMASAGEEIASWNSMEENVYISERAKYSRKSVTVKKHTSLLYDIFLLEASEKNGFPITNQYLDEAIKRNQFISVFNGIKTPNHFPEQYKIHDFYEHRIQIENNTISTGVFLLHFKDFQDIIYEKMESIFSGINKEIQETSDKNKLQKLENDASRLFHHLIKSTNHKNIGQRYNNNNDESFRIPGVITPSYTMNDIIKMVKNNLDNVKTGEVSGMNTFNLGFFCNIKSEIEKTSMADVSNTINFFVKNRNNKTFSKENIVFDYHILTLPEIAIPAINTFLQTLDSKTNPLTCIAHDNHHTPSLDIISHTSSDEDNYKNPENKKKIKESIKYLFDKTFEDGSIHIKQPEKYKTTPTQDIFSGLILSSNIDSNMFFEALSDEQTKIIIKEYSKDLNVAIMKSYNEKLTISKTPKGERGLRELNSILYKLTENGFKFDLDYDKPEHCKTICKLLYSYNHPKAFNAIFEANDIPIIKVLSTLILEGKDDSLDIINIFQNENLQKLIHSNSEWNKLNAIFMNTDSDKTYGGYLDSSKILNKDNAKEFLLEAVKEGNYSSALAIVQREPESIIATEKNKRLPLESALKDFLSFNKSKGKYFSKERAECATKFILHVAENNDTLIEDKKSRTGLFSSLNIDHPKPIQDVMSIYFAKQQQLAIGKEMNKISKDNDSEEELNHSFKL